MQPDSLQLEKNSVGALPIIDHFMRRLGVAECLGEAIEHEPYREALELLVKSILIRPNALYRLREWASRYDSKWVGDLSRASDDVLGRSLDRLFKADRASLLTRLTLNAIRNFEINTDRIHNDSTPVKFCGAFHRQNQKAVQIKRGYSNDGSKLKQLVYSLSIAADGAVPVHFKCYDGNQIDDKTHWETWLAIRGLLRRSDFVYVADSKLCVSETLLKIDREQGCFVTTLPRHRVEAKQFAEDAYYSQVRWSTLWHFPSARHKGSNSYSVAEGLHQMKEGFRIYWLRSSDKAIHDAKNREDRITAALSKLEEFRDRPRRRPKSAKPFTKAAEQILARFKATEWIDLKIEVSEVETFKQDRRGRSSESATYRKVIVKAPKMTFKRNFEAIARSQAMDGVFPLITNTKLTALEVLKHYKYQPRIERRHSLFKSVLEVSPVFLKKNDRIEALMFLYFIAQMISALIERHLRVAMQENNIVSLPILPESRPSKSPSPEQILSSFEGRCRYELKDGSVLVKTFVDPLTEVQAQLIKLLNVPRSNFL